MTRPWFEPPSALQFFALLVRDDAQLPLLEAAASLAQDEYPELDVQQVLDEVDRLALRLRRSVGRGGSVLDRLRGLGRFFFGELGFAGNVNDYYNPANSHLNEVLRTRRGIPISLAVLWLELARGLDLQVDGVGFPGHFLVQAHLAEGRIVIDPFTGQSLGSDALRERLGGLSLLRIDGAAPELPLALYLEPATPRQILARMLGNLQGIHRGAQDWRRLVAVQDRLIALLPQAWAEYRNRGLALAELGERQRACADLALYLQRSPGASDGEVVLERLRELGGPSA